MEVLGSPYLKNPTWIQLKGWILFPSFSYIFLKSSLQKSALSSCPPCYLLFLYQTHCYFLLKIILKTILTHSRQIFQSSESVCGVTTCTLRFDVKETCIWYFKLLYVSPYPFSLCVLYFHLLVYINSMSMALLDSSRENKSTWNTVPILREVTLYKGKLNSRRADMRGAINEIYLHFFGTKEKSLSCTQE